MIVRPATIFHGCKIWEIPYIDELLKPKIKDIKYFIEPFGGSGIVSLYIREKYPEIKVIYNDINPYMIKLFSDIKILEISQIEEEFNAIIHTFDTYKRINDSIPNITSAQYIYLVQNCFRGFFGSKMPNTDSKKNLKKKTKYDFDNMKYIKTLISENFEILNIPANDLIEKYKENKDVLFYLDPPYISKGICNEGYQKYQLQDVVSLFEQLKKIKSLFILSYDFNGFLYVNFSDNIRFIYPILYNISTGSDVKYSSQYSVLCDNFNTHICRVVKDLINNKKRFK